MPQKMKDSTYNRLLLVLVFAILLVGGIAVFLGLKVLNKEIKLPVSLTNTLPPPTKLIVTEQGNTPILPVFTPSSANSTEMIPGQSTMPLLVITPVAGLSTDHPPFDFIGQTCESCHNPH